MATTALTTRSAPDQSDPNDLVDERQIDRWVQELKRIVVGGQIELASRVGEFLIDKVYRGEAEALAHTPGKAASLRRLAERAEEFGMTAAGLRRAVPIALQVRALGRDLAERLGARQHRALLPIKDKTEKVALAQAAASEGWSAEQLQARVRKVKRPHRGGRPPEPAVQVLVRRLDKLLEQVQFDRMRAELSSLTPSEARRLLGRVNSGQALLERLEKLLTRGVARRG